MYRIKKYRTQEDHEKSLPKKGPPLWSPVKIPFCVTELAGKFAEMIQLH